VAVPQREYKRRHDCIASLIHYIQAKQAGFIVPEIRWRNSPPRVGENFECKDFPIVYSSIIILILQLSFKRVMKPFN